MNKKLKHIFIISPIIILLLGVLQHSVYEWIPINFIGLWVPVSESVWEHLKIVFYPILIWWIVAGIIFDRKCNINCRNWLAGATVSSLVAPMLVVMFYYAIFDGFGCPEMLAIHIAIQTVSLLVAQAIGYHIYSNVKNVTKLCTIFMVIILVIMVVLFGVFSFVFPNLPIFIDS
ncbi:MAG: DUF6512 family protein [Clostridia bacterium]